MDFSGTRCSSVVPKTSRRRKSGGKRQARSDHVAIERSALTDCTRLKATLPKVKVAYPPERNEAVNICSG
jgi:hypothetical protein